MVLNFVPYFRRRFSDSLADSGNPANIGIPVSLDIIELSNANAVVPASDTGPLTAPLRGPGDILGINPSVIARVEPSENSNDFEQNYFPFIEFNDPDFPWRYSLDTDATHIDNQTVEPWLCLIVLSNDEINEMIKEKIDCLKTIKDGRELLTVSKKYLPDCDKLWANAHVQLVSDGTTSADQALKDYSTIIDYIQKYPSNSHSRLFCLRQLLPNTAYTAFLVPVYKAGVEAFMETDITSGNSKSWGDSTDPVQLPVYYKWGFMTSEKGDFEELARKLSPYKITSGSAGIKAVDASPLIPQGSTDKCPYYMREGALSAPGFILGERENYQTSLRELTPDYETNLKNTLNESLKSFRNETGDEDPLVTLPAYGRFFRKTASIDAPDNRGNWPGSSPWVNEMNLDARNRTAGGFGSMAIRRHQEEFMRECWYQVGEIRKANEKIRLTKSGFHFGKQLENKNITPLTNEMFAMVTTPFHAHFTIKDGTKEYSIKKAFRISGIAKGAISPAFRKIAYRALRNKKLLMPFTPWAQAEKNKKSGILLYWYKLLMSYIECLRKISMKAGINKLLKYLIALLITICMLILRLLGFIQTKPPNFTANDKLKLKNIETRFGITLEPGAYKNNYIAPPKAEVIAVKPVVIDVAFRAKFDILQTLKTKLSGLIKFNDGRTVNDNFDPILACPKIDIPTYGLLCELSDDYFIPGVENLEKNGVTLLEENRRFIEAFLCGLNHEMNNELVWRDFPTDRRGTVFSYFWQAANTVTPAQDIREIHKWTGALGNNPLTPAPGNDPNLVLVIKGDLVRRYPSTIIYAVKIADAALQADTARYGWKFKFWSQYGDYALPENAGAYQVIEPLFRAHTGTDILLIGFNFSKKKIEEQTRDGEYYFVFQEHYNLPRFGMDVSTAAVRRGASDVPESMSWDNTQIQKNDGGYLKNLDNSVLFGNTVNGLTAVNAATIAWKTYQQPIRVAIHQFELLGKE